MKLSILMDIDDINRTIPYPVIVEGWDKKNYGKVKRAYDKEFTEKEKRIIGSYYPKMYKWYLVTGLRPCHIIAENIPILQRAGMFFGGI